MWEAVGENSKEKGALCSFFTSFIDDYKSKDMYVLFRKFEKIYEVIIVAKLDKRRRRYGFVRFFNV